MTQNPILSVADVAKKYSLSLPANRRRLQRRMARAALGFGAKFSEVASEEFWAVKGVSFDIHKGEAIGLIGRNGAGKSTLLQMISGHIEPDAGEVRSDCDIAELMNLTAGYQLDLSGIENLLIVGSLRGLSQAEINERKDEIVEFAEIGDFINAPFRTYSRGMKMRLAFSVAVHTNPDLLLIDEVLGVGDYAFRQKCLAKLESIREKTSFVLVSHNLLQITRFCERALVLDQGGVQFDGPSGEAVDFYTEQLTAELGQFSLESTGDEETGDGLVPARSETAASSSYGPVFEDAASVSNVEMSWLDQDDGDAADFHQKDPIRLCIQADLLNPVSTLDAVLFLYSRGGEPVARIGYSEPDVSAGRISFVVDLREHRLAAGVYVAVVRVADGGKTIFRQPIRSLVVRGKKGTESWGLTRLKSKWSFRFKKLETE